jgi:hypothetical protein
MRKKENNTILSEHLDEILSHDDHILVLIFHDLKIYFHDFDEIQNLTITIHNDLT